MSIKDREYIICNTYLAFLFTGYKNLITNILYKDLKNLDGCRLKCLLAPGTHPNAAYNITKDDIFIHDNVDDDDLICLFLNINNNPIKKSVVSVVVKGFIKDVGEI